MKHTITLEQQEVLDKYNVTRKALEAKATLYYKIGAPMPKCRDCVLSFYGHCISNDQRPRYRGEIQDLYYYCLFALLPKKEEK
jgi:hypothetical protein